MPTDPTLDSWLDAWERHRQQEPALTPDEFVRSLPPDMPAEVRDELRRAIGDLAWITELMERVKRRDSLAKECPPTKGS